MPSRANEVDRVRAQLAQAEDRLARAFMGMLALARRRGGDPMSALEAEAHAFTHELEAVYVQAGQLELDRLTRGRRQRMRFDPSHPTTAPVLAQTKRKFITNFLDTQSRTAKAAARAAKGDTLKLAKARKPIFTSDSIRNADWFGLTPNQEVYVANYRRDLTTRHQRAVERVLRDRRYDRTVEGAIAEDVPLNGAQIDRMVSAYRRRWIVHRAKTIAQTQALTAVNSGRHAALKQVARTANFDPDRIVRTWNTMQDNKVRDSHDELDGTDVEGMDEPFIGMASEIMYPGDPAADPSEIIGCRCWLEYSLPGEN